MSATTTGRLVLVPNTLDLGTAPGPIEQVLSAHALRRAAGLQHWVVESAKVARSFLKRVDAVVPLTAPLQTLAIQELPKARKGGGTVEADAWQALLAPAMAGHDVGLLSDAGLPAVADPGAAVVAAAHVRGLVVEPLAGASSLTVALAASGLNGQRFAFEGYLPQQPAQRLQRVRDLELRSRREGQTQLVIETPYRNEALLQALAEALRPDTSLSVACGLTSATGWCRTQAAGEWRRQLQGAGRTTMPDTLPAVFMWLAR